MLFQFDLFEVESTLSPAAEKVKETPARRPRLSAGWQITNHACRHCLGRVLQRVSRSVVVEVRCAECGKSEDGPVRMLCACGADCGDLGHALECFKNPNVTDEIPHEVLVRERPAEKREKTIAPARPVKLPGY